MRYDFDLTKGRNNEQVNNVSLGYVGVDSIKISGLNPENLLCELGENTEGSPVHSFQWEDEMGSVWSPDSIFEPDYNGRALNVNRTRHSFSIELEYCFHFSHFVTGNGSFNVIRIDSQWLECSNLFVMRRREIVPKLQKALRLIDELTHLHFSWNLESLTVTEAELSITIPSDYSLDECKRPLNLLKFMIDRHRQGRKAAKSANFEKINAETQSYHEQTKYLSLGPSSSIVAYDKGAQLNEKSSQLGIRFDCNLLRFEISCDAANMANFFYGNQLSYIQLSDFIADTPNFEEYFYDYFSRYFRFADEYLCNQGSVNLKRDGAVFKILVAALDQAARTNTLSSFIESLCINYLEEERIHGYPTILDIEEIGSILHSLYGMLNPSSARRIENEFVQFKKNEDYPELKNQLDIYEMLKRVLTGKDENDIDLEHKEFHLVEKFCEEENLNIFFFPLSRKRVPLREVFEGITIWKTPNTPCIHFTLSKPLKDADRMPIRVHFYSKEDIDKIIESQRPKCSFILPETDPFEVTFF